MRDLTRPSHRLLPILLSAGVFLAAAGAFVGARPVTVNPTCGAGNAGEMVTHLDAGLMVCNGSSFVAAKSISCAAEGAACTVDGDCCANLVCSISLCVQKYGIPPTAMPATFTNTSETLGQWSKKLFTVSEFGNPTVTRVAAPVWLDGGATAMKVSAIGDFDPDTSTGYAAWARGIYTFNRAGLDATTYTLQFDMSMNDPEVATVGYSVFEVAVYDRTGANITNTLNGIQRAMTFGTARDYLAGSAANITLMAFDGGPNVKRSVSFNLKTYVENCLAAGKTWSDVDRISVVWFMYTPTITEFYLDVNNVH